MQDCKEEIHTKEILTQAIQCLVLGFRDSILPLSISTHIPYRTQSHLFYLHIITFLNKHVSDPATQRIHEAPQPRSAKRQKVTVGQGDLEGEKQECTDFTESLLMSPQYDTLIDSDRSSHLLPQESSHCSPLCCLQCSSLVGRTSLLPT